MMLMRGGSGRCKQRDKERGRVHHFVDTMALAKRTSVVVVREPWRLHPLAWIHRAEARAIARELDAPMLEYPALPEGLALLRLSDPVMRIAVNEIRSPYRGPGREALERCYDKHEASRIVRAAGLRRALTHSSRIPRRLRPRHSSVKPRRGSDSMGVSIANGVPRSKRNADHLVQARVIGHEVTIALFREEVGVPFRILVPPGEIYSFSSKYLTRPGRVALDEEALRERAKRIGRSPRRRLGRARRFHRRGKNPPRLVPRMRCRAARGARLRVRCELRGSGRRSAAATRLAPLGLNAPDTGGMYMRCTASRWPAAWRHEDSLGNSRLREAFAPGTTVAEHGGPTQGGPMKKLICACIASLHLAGCTTLTTVPYSNGTFEKDPVRAGDRVVLKAGARVHDFEVASATREEICSRSECVRVEEIQSIERKEVSVLRTVGAIVIIAAIALALGSMSMGFPAGY
jgi:hypothetical protein